MEQFGGDIKSDNSVTDRSRRFGLLDFQKNSWITGYRQTKIIRVDFQQVNEKV